MIETIPLQELPVTRDIKLVKAAVKLGDKVFTAWRHSDILRHLGQAGTPQHDQDAQGFIASNGSFYSRYQSARIAWRAQQIRRIPHTLTSEDLWDVNGVPRDPEEAYDPMGDAKKAQDKDPNQAARDKAREMIARTKGRR